MTATNTKKCTCTKCNGTGHIAGYEHIMGGICFKCWGKGEIETVKAEKREKKTIVEQRFVVIKRRKYQVVDKVDDKVIAEYAWSVDARNHCLKLRAQQAS